jgi:hypothetical protein
MSIRLRGDVMYHPAHIDGRSVVILRSDRWGCSALEGGILIDWIAEDAVDNLPRLFPHSRVRSG